MKLLLFLTFLCWAQMSFSQSCSDLNFQLQAETETTCFKSTMTMLHDRIGRDYLYVANKEDGLTIYDVTDLSNPNLVKQIPTSELSGQQVMNLSQQGNYLYLAIGNTFNSTDASGMAIVNISNPIAAFVEDVYILAGSQGGSGIVETEGDYAYLGAMGNGMIILDISQKSDIQFVSQFIPQVNWPDANQDPLKVNARGMAVRDDTVYLCYDAGGFRMIDVSQKSNPVEIGRYSNPLMNGLPRAYNNISLDGQLAFIAVDYCGLEILDFSDASNIQLKGWWNPYNCPNNNWFTSPVHANEIRLNKNCQQVFLSTGKSDLIVLDVSDRTTPDSCNYFGGISNNIGTWGVDVYENKLFLSYVCTFGIPFASNWSGFKTITFNNCSLGNQSLDKDQFSWLSPNPVHSQLDLPLAAESFELLSSEGKLLLQGPNTGTIDVSSFGSGVYYLLVKGAATSSPHKLFIE